MKEVLLSHLLARFAPLLTSVSEQEIEKDVTLGGRLILDQVDKLRISYAPFEHVQPEARLVLVGITPGAQQARNALRAVRRHILAGSSHSAALEGAKIFASFSGPMRSNLVAMLDFIGLARWLGVSSVDTLWNENSRTVNFTSALRYPVFVSGENYAGTPSMTATPILLKYLRECLLHEARALPEAVWVPLGPRAAEGVSLLVKEGVLDRSRVLDGLPHPSGANAERIAYFLGRKARAALSKKTSPEPLDASRKRLIDQVSQLAPGRNPAPRGP